MPPKLKGFDFYHQTLKSAKHVVAPMVDASELAWRQLARRHGADLCYTPMWHSGVFVRDANYRQQALQTCPEDRPLIVQFCANDPDTFKKAVDYTVKMIDCDAIDLNIGCPQVIARRGHFGSFLQDEWDLLRRLVGAIHDNFDVPITCKLRIFDDMQKTVDYAKMLESAGAQLLTVHGRTREQKGHVTGLASWEHIKAVVQAVNVPVFANGNIQYLEDVQRCIRETGVQGVMSAEGHLNNPALFAGKNPPAWELCLEYLDLAERYPCPRSYVRGHLFRLMHHALQMKDNFDIRMTIAKGHSLEEFRSAVLLLRERMLPFHTGERDWTEPEELKVFKLKFPPWICQPYVRPPPEEHLRKMEEIKEKEKKEKEKKRKSEELEEENPGELSKRKQKKLQRNPNQQFPHGRKNCKLCVTCKNPAGTKCQYDMCRGCCRPKCFQEELDCTGHRIQVKSKREFARKMRAEREQAASTAGTTGEAAAESTAEAPATMEAAQVQEEPDDHEIMQEDPEKVEQN